MPELANREQSVSVVITTFNRPDYLEQAIASVVAQSHPVDQIIVVDDCSPIPLQPIIDKFTGSQIVYERLSRNSGPNRARNRGVELANSRWVAFLDDDDQWLPTKIAVQISALLDHSDNHDWVGGVCSYRFYESGKDRNWGRSGRVCLESLKSGNPYCGTSGLIADRELLSDLRFDENLPCGQDWDIFVRLAQVGALIYLQQPLFLYRRGSHDSVTLKAMSLKIDELEPRLASVYKHRDWLGDGPFRTRLASQALAYFPHKKDRLMWVKESIRLAGLVATIRVLAGKVRARLMRSEA